METNQPETPGRLARVELSLTVGLLATLVAFALAVAYQFLESYRSAIVFLAAALGGAATVTSAYYAAKSLAVTTIQNAESIERQRVLTAFEYMERWNDPAFGKTKLRWRLILAELRGRSGEAMSAVLEADPHKRSVVQDVLNHFEELALAVRRGIVDEGFLKD